ncbi:MAG: FAD-dependent oxidoreductase [Elusimicrobiota bacterium]|jgi:all-trans-retinol 13,14-reductase|nr:FAD-dependent oxidoreductase [Elusimicrobiota bacterium]
MTNKYDAAIIGGGIAGLTSAILFAKRGKRTAVFEQSTQIAPLLSGFDRKGVHFETGFHYSGSLGAGEAGGFLFRELGVDVPLEQYNDQFYDEMTLLGSNRTFKIPTGKDLKKAYIDFFPHQKEGINKYFDLVSQAIEQTPFLNIHKDRFLLDDIFRFNASSKTLKEVLDELFSDDEIKSMLSFSSILYGTPPSLASFFMHAYSAGAMNESIWKIKGGARVLVEAFKKAMESSGVEVFCKKKAVKIEIEGDEKIIHFSDGSTVKSDICASSIHPKEFIKIAPQGVYRAKNIERIMNIPETPGFFTVYAKSRSGKVYNYTNKAFLRDGSYKNDNKDFMYINFSNLKPQGLSLILSVDSNKAVWDIPKEDYARKKEVLLQRIKEESLQYMGFDMDDIEVLDISTPVTLNRYVGYYGCYGPMHLNAGAGILPITKIAGLFVIGQGVISPGIIGAMISAFLLDKIIYARK